MSDKEHISGQEVQTLREKLENLMESRNYRAAAGVLAKLEKRGATGWPWLRSALIVAAALGDVQALRYVLKRMKSDRSALISAVKTALAEAVREKQPEASRILSDFLWRSRPANVRYRIIKMLDVLSRQRVEGPEVRELFSSPLPLKDVPGEVIRSLVLALQDAGFSEDARRMHNYLVRREPLHDEEAREDAAGLAYNLKDYSLVLSLLEPASSLKHRYICSLACGRLLKWQRLRKIRLRQAELSSMLDSHPDWIPSMLFDLNLLPGYTDFDKQALARRASSLIRAERKGFHKRPLERSKKLRIGYLSGDFKRHPCNFLACPVFEKHDRSGFYLCAFDNSLDDGSEERSRILSAFDEAVRVRHLSDKDLAGLIEQKGIDILVDMSGRTTDNRSSVLAWRPAPVQATWLGFPGGLGGGIADYLVADQVTVPGEQEGAFDEAVVRLPVCYIPGGELPSFTETPTRSEHGLPGGCLVFACFNQHGKISEAAFNRWCLILKSSAGSILWLSSGPDEVQEQLRKQASVRGIDPARIIFAPRLPREAHLQRTACADLALDCHPYNMHATAVDALAAGVPFLTFLGRTMAGRVSASLLRTAGLEDCVCSSPGEYVRRMICLAENAEERKSLRQRFEAACIQSRLFDPAAFARDLEAAYDRIYENWRSGRSPAPVRL